MDEKTKKQTRKRIAYGVMGYGRGHAMRTASVLPELMQHYDVTLYCGGDAHDALSAQFEGQLPIRRIPTIGYAYGSSGRISVGNTLKKNFRPMSDVLLGGTGMKWLLKAFQDERPDVVISDSEAWTHRAAMKLRIPRISFDHVGIIAYCLPPLPEDLWFKGHRDGWGYRMLMGEPERILISSFHPAITRRPGIEIIGPMLRDEVLAQKPVVGDYLLAYFNKGEHQFLPPVEKALRGLDTPVVIYGTPQGKNGECQSGNLLFKPLHPTRFVEDLAGSKAVISTAGNQLIGECLHFGKPIFTLPEDCFEQKLNAYMVRCMGIGERGDYLTITTDDLENFLVNTDSYRARTIRHRRNGRTEATRRLHQFITDLTNPESINQPIPAKNRAKPAPV